LAILGIDIGTQSLKAVVTDDGLSPLGSGFAAYPVRYPQPGWAEQDAKLWESALGPAVAAALASAGVDAGDVRALGIAGQLDGCLAVDARGVPCSPCLIWMDRRAGGDLPELDLAAFRDATGLVADGGHMGAKIRWLKRSLPLPRGARFHQPVSYMVERLTGAFLFDHSLASTTMLYRLEKRAWDADLLALFSIDADELPVIAEAAAAAGALSPAGAALTGLRAGIPVAVGTGDDFATPLGAGLSQPGAVACVLGTAEVVGALARQPTRDPGALVETHGYPGGLYFIENPGWLSGGALVWLKELCGFRDFAALEEEAAAAPPGAGGVLFLPALSGAMAPEWNAAARGCFYGLTPAHGRGHVARALLEGCALAMRDVVERLSALGVESESLLLLGGGARSSLWSQVRADVSGRLARASRRVDTCPLGAALLAAVASGLQPDVESSAALLRGEEERFLPDARHTRLYDELHARYRLLFNSLRPLFGE
jgi:xylulokinase